MKTYKSVDDYISSADSAHRDKLILVRDIVLSTVPEAEEGIAYGMPSYKYHGEPLFYFAAMKGHLGLYPTPGPIIALADKLKEYSTSKGCVRVPYKMDIDKKLIVSLLKERVKEIKVGK